MSSKDQNVQYLFMCDRSFHQICLGKKGKTVFNTLIEIINESNRKLNKL